jgi:hypothetical protein
VLQGFSSRTARNETLNCRYGLVVDTSVGYGRSLNLASPQAGNMTNKQFRVNTGVGNSSTLENANGTLENYANRLRHKQTN